jgi:type II secretory pathway pseudopilin PulG
MNRGITLLEVVVIVAVVGIMAAIFLPLDRTAGAGRQRLACANHLKQLHAMGHIYASLHRGRWPEETGAAFWTTFQRMNPPLLESDLNEIYFCPILAQPGDLGQTDYRGPASNVNPGTADDPIGADKIGNHGEGYGGNVLRKAGDVQELDRDDPLWGLCRTRLSP